MVMVASSEFDRPTTTFDSNGQKNPAVWFWNNIPVPILEYLETELKDIPFARADTMVETESQAGDRQFTMSKLPQYHWLEALLANAGRWSILQSQWNINAVAPDAVELWRFAEGDSYASHIDDNWLREQPFSCKITVLALLNDPDTFEGGHLKFKGAPNVQKFTRGTVVAFPSILEYEITPVTKGSAWYASACLLGPKWA